MTSSAQAILVWIFAIVILFVLILGYTTMSRVLTGGIMEDVENMTEVNQSADATSVLSGQKTVWQYWIYFAILAFLLWAVFASGGGS